jgi:hypothetical protein
MEGTLRNRYGKGSKAERSEGAQAMRSEPKNPETRQADG